MHPRLRVLTHGPSHFFGFHDLTPWAPPGDRLVALRTTTSEDHVPVESDVAEVVVIDEQSGDVRVVAETGAWNWQQGARQQWLDASRIIFNSRGPDGFVSTIVDLESGVRSNLPLTVSDISPAGDAAVTVDYVRLHRLYEPYGYAAPAGWQLRDPSQDGLFSLDLTSGSSQCLLTIEDVARSAFGDVMPERDFFTHPSFSPSGHRVCLLHRRIVAAGAMTTNLVVMDLASGDWRIIADDRVSHLDWEDDDHIVVWCRRNPAMSRLKRSPLLGLARTLYRISKRLTSKRIRRSVYRESFRRFDLATGADEPVGLGILDEDGHPMVNPHDSGLWVNDTYPDANNLQTLMLFDSRQNRRIDLLRLSTPVTHAMTGWRCDFHPRWDPSGTKVCIDSAHLGRRQLCTIDVQDAMAELSPAIT